jgi:DNA replication protein DnaC
MNQPLSDFAFDPETLDLDAVLKRLNLANSRRLWPALAERADADGWSARRFLAILLAEEIAHRQQTRLTREARAAGFPYLKTIDDFDFTFQKSLNRRLVSNFLTPEAVTEGRNLILLGRTGRGKTHLAVAIAYRAIQNGFTARFVTAAELIDHLSTASRSGSLRDALADYLHPSVLVVDEVGYLTYGDDAANVLFHVVNGRHIKARSTIFTTNKSPFTKWGHVLHDPDLADTIVDRTLERGLLIAIDGPSYRTRHLPELALDTDLEPARISGKDRPEFPERAGRNLFACHPLRLVALPGPVRGALGLSPSTPLTGPEGVSWRSWCHLPAGKCA